jgi:hypothetical protein
VSVPQSSELPVTLTRERSDLQYVVVVDPALQGFLIGLAPTLVSAGFAVRLARLKNNLEAELHERIARVDRQLNAEELLTRYREPLAGAAFDLQSRCWNILEKDFFVKFGDAHERSGDALMTTLFRFAQYFGWTEILRREVQFLSFPTAQETRDVTDLQQRIAERLATSATDEPLMIWVDEQRAIGERMIVESADKVRCMGYGAFCDSYDECFARHFSRVRDELAAPLSTTRYREVQHLLCDLVATLDKDHVRYPEKLLRHAD